MIKATNVTMKFDDFTALDNLCCNIPKGSIYGLVGSNGAGKSTFLRLISGIYKSVSGEITFEGENVYDNPTIKDKIAFVPDDIYFLPAGKMKDMAKLYAAAHENFSNERFENLMTTFSLPLKKPISSFSKGMKRQAAIILALSTMPEYLFLDETFDGLDVVMRDLVKRVIYTDVAERNTTVVIASHSLRELEDTCDQLALLHKGKIVFESDIQNLKTSLFKVQIGFSEDFTKEKFQEIDLVDYSQKGSIATFIVKGDQEKVTNQLSSMSPTILDILPLSLEEVFIHELEALGYAFKEIII
jgi:ABC-2 type transport system ATP-binding protein